MEIVHSYWNVGDSVTFCDMIGVILKTERQDGIIALTIDFGGNDIRKISHELVIKK